MLGACTSSAAAMQCIIASCVRCYYSQYADSVVSALLAAGTSSAAADSVASSAINRCY